MFPVSRDAFYKQTPRKRQRLFTKAHLILYRLQTACAHFALIKEKEEKRSGQHVRIHLNAIQSSDARTFSVSEYSPRIPKPVSFSVSNRVLHLVLICVEF